MSTARRLCTKGGYMVPEWGEGGFLPPGRYRIDPDEAEQLLVADERFQASATRAQLWSGLDTYLSRFFDLEERHQGILDGSQLIHALWLGGSYVSSKIDPQNIDLTVLIDERAASAIRGLEGTRWLSSAFNRRARLAEFGVSPLRSGIGLLSQSSAPSCWTRRIRRTFGSEGHGTTGGSAVGPVE